jgi:hypothetical protein
MPEEIILPKLLNRIDELINESKVIQERRKEIIQESEEIVLKINAISEKRVIEKCSLDHKKIVDETKVEKKKQYDFITSFREKLDELTPSSKKVY